SINLRGNDTLTQFLLLALAGGEFETPQGFWASPPHYGLLETDGQLKALCGLLDKKEMDSLELDESRFITCGKSEFKAYGGHLHKLYNNRAKVGALSLRKHLGPLQFQEKLVGS
ncbi:hypothetical protein PIB30_102891, partial [Stylosanthes scabra]|nr:hypothetical protein [Stylosanthes scabra]